MAMPTMPTPVTTRRAPDIITREELRNLIGKDEADKYFAQKNHYVMLGKTKQPTKDDITAARRMWTGTSPERSRDFSRANTLARWFLAANEADRKRHLRFLDMVEEMIDKNEPITLESLGAKFKGTHIRNSNSGTPAQAAARKKNLAFGREVRRKKLAKRKGA
jgi:hypothetical protein